MYTVLITNPSHVASVRLAEREPHLLHELELVGENPIRKRENVCGVRWWLYHMDDEHDELKAVDTSEKLTCYLN